MIGHLPHALVPWHLRPTSGYTPLFIAASVLCAVWSTHSRPGSSPTSSQLAVLAGVCAALAVIAAVDLAVIVRRRRSARHPRRAAR